MEVTDQDFTVCFLYDQLRVEIIRCLNDYIDNRRGSIAELKERFRRSLPEAARRRVRSVKQLVDALEKQGVIGDNNVKIIKMLAEKLELEELIKKVEEFERDVSGRVQRTLDAATKAPAVIWEIFKGGVQTSVIHLKAVLSCRGVQVTIAAATLLSIYGMNPEALKNLQPFLDLGAQLVTLVRGSVVFVLKISSIASLKRLRKGYKDGSLKKSMKKALNEMKELKELSKGEEIDVEVTIDEEEYHEVFWNLILSEEKANNVSKDQSTRDAEKRRRHSICCERDVPKENSKPLGMTQIQIRVGRHVSELDKVIDYLKASELDQVTRFEDMRIARIIELQKERLMDVRREISEMKIFLAASRVSQIRVEEGFEGHLKDLPKGEVPQIRVPFPDPVSSYSVASAGERISSSWQDEKGIKSFEFQCEHFS